MVLMAIKPERADRRADALSKQRIVEAAIAILDSGGESALTFRALAARLATGSGAIYWHVANKSELLAAAADDVIARVMTDAVDDTEPREAIRTLALGVFVHGLAADRLAERLGPVGYLAGDLAAELAAAFAWLSAIADQSSRESN